MVFCEPVLAFIKAFRLKGDANALKQAALSRFSIPMLFSAKKSLWAHCEEVLSSLELPFTPRRSSEKRSQAAADLDDILLAFSKLDDDDKIPEIYCEAAELVKLPPVSTDPIGEMIAVNASSLKVIEDSISQLQVVLAGLSSKLDSSALAIPPPASYASALQSAPCTASALTKSPVAGRPNTSKDNRSDSLIVFGLPEVKSLTDLRQSVDEVLTFVVGRPVPLNDLFRLGRLKPPGDSTLSPPLRPRPVILKLSSAWDRRLVLSTVRKLKGYAIKRIYICEDLSLEDRQRRMELARTRNPSAANIESVRADVSTPSQIQSRWASNDTSVVNQDS